MYNINNYVELIQRVKEKESRTSDSRSFRRILNDLSSLIILLNSVKVNIIVFVKEKQKYNLIH